MKRVLLLILSSEDRYWGDDYRASLATWDSIEVDGVETIYYFGKSYKQNTNKNIYTDTIDGFWNLGYRTVEAFDWALKNKEFDYIFRANSSMYINKEKLARYAQFQHAENLALGVLAPTTYAGRNFLFMWGGSGYLLSRDVIEKIVLNRMKWNNRMMEDVALTDLLNKIDITPLGDGSACSMDKKNGEYTFIAYSKGFGGGATLKDLQEINTNEVLKNQFCIRVKCDHDRGQDVVLMNELFKAYADV